MMVNRTTRMMLIVVAALGLVAAGCSDDNGFPGEGSGDAEDVLEGLEDLGGGDGDFDIDIDSEGEGGFSFEGGDGEGEGEFSVGAGEIPEGFPDDFPLPDDFQVIAGSKTQAGSEGVFFNVALETDDSVDDVASFYEERLESAGYEIRNKSESTSQGLKQVGFTIGNDDFDGNVAVSRNDGEDVTNVSITLTSARE